eukprot:3198722-Pyramimonas_sp.AAC.1
MQRIRKPAPPPRPRDPESPPRQHRPKPAQTSMQNLVAGLAPSKMRRLSAVGGLCRDSETGMQWSPRSGNGLI